MNVLKKFHLKQPFIEKSNIRHSIASPVLNLSSNVITARLLAAINENQLSQVSNFKLNRKLQNIVKIKKMNFGNTDQILFQNLRFFELQLIRQASKILIEIHHLQQQLNSCWNDIINSGFSFQILISKHLLIFQQFNAQISQFFDTNGSVRLIFEQA